MTAHRVQHQHRERITLSTSDRMKMQEYLEGASSYWNLLLEIAKEETGRYMSNHPGEMTDEDLFQVLANGVQVIAGLTQPNHREVEILKAWESVEKNYRNLPSSVCVNRMLDMYHAFTRSRHSGANKHRPRSNKDTLWYSPPSMKTKKSTHSLRLDQEDFEKGPDGEITIHALGGLRIFAQAAAASEWYQDRNYEITHVTITSRTPKTKDLLGPSGSDDNRYLVTFWYQQT